MGAIWSRAADAGRGGAWVGASIVDFLPPPAGDYLGVGEEGKLDAGGACPLEELGGVTRAHEPKEPRRLDLALNADAREGFREAYHATQGTITRDVTVGVTAKRLKEGRAAVVKGEKGVERLLERRGEA